MLSAKQKSAVPAVLAAFLWASWVTVAGAGTLQDVQATGRLTCGVAADRPGFSYEEGNGRWTGLDVDTCRAIAAATLGDAGKVDFLRLSAKERLTALQAGDVDLLARSTTWTLSRDASLNFAATTFYDGQAFLVRKELSLKNAEELDGAAVCVGLGTTTELNLSDFFRSKGMELRMVRSTTTPQAISDYEAGKCDAMAHDRSGLAAIRSGLVDPSLHVILPDILSKEPLGPVVRHGDDQWFDIVNWTVFALIQAEESGVTSANVDEMKSSSQDPGIHRLLGVAGDLGRQLGLSNDWAYQIVKQVGNYGEVYERNLGPNTPLRLERGLNALWFDGGLMYAIPFR